MATSSTIPTQSEAPLGLIPPGVRWFLPSLTLLLAALAVFQAVYFVPRCMFIVQRFGGIPPAYLNLLLRIPEWSAVVVALALGGVAFWQRGSVGRSALLATTALAINLGLLICLLGALFQVLSLV